MVNFSRYNIGTASETGINEGLRLFMLSVYNYMTLALFITGLVGYFASSSEYFMNMLYHTSADGSSSGISFMGTVILFAPLVLVFAISAKIYSIKVQTAQMLFWLYSLLMGLSLSSIFMVYTGESIARAFFITASTFGAASIYGYVTKKNLASWGSFLMMGVIGLVIASLVNLFFQSSAIVFAVSLLSVIIFTGLTAYDVQNLRKIYLLQGNNSEQMKKTAIIGALGLYINFINIFISILRFFGERK